jgi:hypothetical protein
LLNRADYATSLMVHKHEFTHLWGIHHASRIKPGNDIQASERVVLCICKVPWDHRRVVSL